MAQILTLTLDEATANGLIAVLETAMRVDAYKSGRIAVPIINAKEQLIGALNVSGLRIRLTPIKLERARRALIREAAALRKILA